MAKSIKSRAKPATAAQQLKTNPRKSRKTPVAAAVAMKPDPILPPKAGSQPAGKIELIATLLRRPEGANINDLMKATGWQAHSVRGAISAAIKKKLGLRVISEKSGTVRLYRIADKPAS